MLTLLLGVGVAFHVGIALMGLASFAVTMCAALLLFLQPVDAPLHLAARATALRDRFSGRRQRSVRAPATARGPGATVHGANRAVGRLPG